jgi:hypothetical protein
LYLTVDGNTQVLVENTLIKQASQATVSARLLGFMVFMVAFMVGLFMFFMSIVHGGIHGGIPGAACGQMPYMQGQP